MNENLIKREELRQSSIESKKRDKELNKIDSENTDYVMKEIYDLKANIEAKLDVLDKRDGKEDIDNGLQEVNSYYERLNQLINDSVLYLAKYNLKLSQT